MKKMQSLILAFACLLMGYSASLRAEDIDIYVDSTGGGDAPNVLIVLDNAANFSASAPTCTYNDDKSAPSLNGTAGGIEQCAIYNVVKGLQPGTVNLGVMVYNSNNIRDKDNANCGGSNGGCLLYPIVPLSGDEVAADGTITKKGNKTLFLEWVKTWKTTEGTGNGQIKAGGKATGATMQEAWAYYAGKTGISKRDYAAVQPKSGCQKNFVIFIGNAFDSSGTPGEGATDSPGTELAAAPGVTEVQKTPILISGRSYGTSTFSCGTAALTNHNERDGDYADEWARYMNQTDIFGGLAGSQGITTYTIGLLSKACVPDYPLMLSSMAKYGGGKYFPVSSYDELAVAMGSILNEVQDIESVFSSASLPVSVNADGTYLNQIFLGMFRPDGSGAPRWLGNLKQYQLIRSKTDSSRFVMGDASLPYPKEAINPNTGFITEDAQSFWTYKDPAAEPDKSGGFWVNHSPDRPFDSPDGEVVEKGGVAQQLRKENLNKDFSKPEYTTDNPRRLYTFCPTGAKCFSCPALEPACVLQPKRLTDPANGFTAANVLGSSFGAGTVVNVASIMRPVGTDWTKATVTTVADHNFNGKSVTIMGANESEYNVTQTVSGSGNTFTIDGLPDYPTTPSQGKYMISLANAASQVAVKSMTYDVATSKVTVKTATNHTFPAASDVKTAGASPIEYNGVFVVDVPDTVDCPRDTCFTYSVTQNPPSTAANQYQVSLPITSISISAIYKVSGNWTVATAVDHGFHRGQQIKLTEGSDFVGTWEVGAVDGPRAFQLAGVQGNKASCSTACGSAEPTATGPFTITTLTRSGTVATATGLPDYMLGYASGNKKTVNISVKASNGGANESAFAVTGAEITCIAGGNNRCNSFTYTVNVSPSGPATGTITAEPLNLTWTTVDAGNVKRIGASRTTVSVEGIAPANLFKDDDKVTLNPVGTAYPVSEGAYYGRNWTVKCLSTSDCSSLTFVEPVALAPATPATGSIRAYSGAVPPDKNMIIRWARGEDNNVGDEKGPGNGVTVRPSIHGDVLHSRPVVLNYGTKGLVAFYGANDGVFRAINASQDKDIGTVPPGGEFWGLVLPEHYVFLNRLRTNYPELKFPTTNLPGAQPKDYFIDGPTGVYQKLDANNNVAEAYIYPTMRRGGNFMYALNVSDPADPKVMWRITGGDTGYEELGQTWSRPRFTKLQGKPDNAVLVFGGGYDTGEDNEPPTAAKTGRGIFVVDAIDKKLIWSATKTCADTTKCFKVDNMNFSIPSDVAFVDRDGDGLTDTMYFGDLGGNVWRATVKDTDTTKWKVERLANLGCEDGAASCAHRRKIFFPPAVLSVGQGMDAYDLVSVATGDREHPLKINDAFYTEDRFFMVIDRTAADPTHPTTDITEDKLPTVAVTSKPEEQTEFILSPAATGFQFDLPGDGEKAVNAPNAVNGLIFFATNQPDPNPPKSCNARLGLATAYAVNPFRGLTTHNTLVGGGLPPSSVAGVMNITTKDEQGNETTTQEKFCIGCAMDCTSSNCSPLENSPPPVTIKKKLRRTYWYKK